MVLRYSSKQRLRKSLHSFITGHWVYVMWLILYERCVFVQRHLLAMMALPVSRLHGFQYSHVKCALNASQITVNSIACFSERQGRHYSSLVSVYGMVSIFQRDGHRNDTAAWHSWYRLTGLRHHDDCRCPGAKSAQRSRWLNYDYTVTWVILRASVCFSHCTNTVRERPGGW